MKHIEKVGAAIAVIALFFMINTRLQADIWNNYEKAKGKAQDAATYLKDTATYAKDRVTTTVSTGVNYIMGELTAVRINPYKDTVARVRTGNELNTHEREFLAKRQPKVK